MKTQISNIKIGHKDVRTSNGYEWDPKHADNVETRRAAFDAIMNENGDKLNAEIDGVRVVMKKHSSTTGKTVWYAGSITVEEYIKIAGHSKGVSTTSENKPLVSLSMNCEIIAYCGSYNQYISNEFITIL